jgi:bacterioferritin-associated ferredoxin
MPEASRELRILDVQLEWGDGTAAVVARVQRMGEPIEIYFRFPAALAPCLNPTVDPFVCGLLVPAMEAGATLRSDLPVSPRLLRGLGRIQHLLSRWFPAQLRTVPVTAAAREAPVPVSPRRAASFFSGGVDSFATVLTHRTEPVPGEPPLTHLVFMHGLEIPLDKAVRTDESETAVKRIAGELGLECIVGETNLRSFFNPSWGEQWCGTGLAATAQALAGGFSTFYIPSSSQILSPIKWGSVPLLDEACSTEGFDIVNDGPLSRAEKIQRVIARHEVALRNLRFCTANMGGPTNCGRCRKCLRTMVALEAAGVLDRVRLDVPPVLPPNIWKLYHSKNPLAARATLGVAREVGGRPWLERGLERKIRRTEMRDGLYQFISSSPLRFALPVYRRIKASLKSLRSDGR